MLAYKPESRLTEVLVVSIFLVTISWERLREAGWRGVKGPPEGWLGEGFLFVPLVEASWC